jgi:cysteine/O-acetylserine efflux protein
MPMSAPVLISFLAYAFTTALTPGPNNFLTLNTVSRFGIKRSLPMMVGILSGIGIIMLITAVLSSFLAAWIPQLSVIARYLGALYILYLAYRIFTSPAPSVDPTQKAPRFVTGMGLQFLNVKIILYAITSLNSFVLPITNDPILVASYGALLTSISGISLVIWAGLGVMLTQIMQKHYRIINLVLALILVESAITLLF